MHLIESIIYQSPERLKYLLKSLFFWLQMTKTKPEIGMKEERKNGRKGGRKEGKEAAKRKRQIARIFISSLI